MAAPAPFRVELLPTVLLARLTLALALLLELLALGLGGRAAGAGWRVAHQAGAGHGGLTHGGRVARSDLGHLHGHAAHPAAAQGLLHGGVAAEEAAQVHVLHLGELAELLESGDASQE